ncbi:protein-L-isoaspartate O-methyltransferase-domain-containing protein [Apiospora marii]|uniref:protein-L-isoaspartate O-methyltransferase-domain-containing protein n=1 Tax=Apiospora marii TaxID=335849 RepID=UPI0031305021
MAWRSSGSSNAGLVENLWKNGLLTSPAVKDAFLRVDRAHYAPANGGPPRRVLDIGSGSGYLTHVLAELAGEDGVVVGVEHIVELKELGERNMAKSPEGRALLESGRCRFRVGDGRKGWAAQNGASAEDGTEHEAGGWDAIHVGAAAEELHEELVRQLRSPGRMFIPVGGRDGWDQYIWTVDKDKEGNVTKRRGYGVRYVPLTDAPGAAGKMVGEL